MYSQLNVDQVGCASQCDSNARCKGFNSTKALDFFHDPVCELYLNTGTQLPSDGVKVAFVKETIPNVNVLTGITDVGTNQARFCKDPLACNKEITRLINSGTVQKFSTNDLDACALCPNRSFTINGFTVTDEFGKSTRTGSSIAAR